MVAEFQTEPSGCEHEQYDGHNTLDDAPGGHAVHPGGSPVGLQKFALHWQMPDLLLEFCGQALKQMPDAHALLKQSLLDVHEPPLFFRHWSLTSTLPGSSQTQELRADDHVEPLPEGQVHVDEFAVDHELPPHMMQGE